MKPDIYIEGYMLESYTDFLHRKFTCCTSCEVPTPVTTDRPNRICIATHIINTNENYCNMQKIRSRHRATLNTLQDFLPE